MLWLVGWGFHLVFSPLRHEIDLCLRLDGYPGLEVECKGSHLYGPLGDATGSIPIVEDIRQWEVRDHPDIVCIEIVAKLPGSDEYTVKNFFNRWVTNLRYREDFADEVD
jgi:hypothetical protein